MYKDIKSIKCVFVNKQLVVTATNLSGGVVGDDLLTDTLLTNVTIAWFEEHYGVSVKRTRSEQDPHDIIAILRETMDDCLELTLGRLINLAWAGTIVIDVYAIGASVHILVRLVEVEC